MVGAATLGALSWLVAKNRREGRSLLMGAAEAVLRLGTDPDRNPLRKDPAIPMPKWMRKAFRGTTRMVEGCRVHNLHPSHPSKWHILYTHGGAYINTIQLFHWSIIRQMIKSTGASVTVVEYPLAPDHNHEHAYRLLDKVYTEVDSEKVILAGDSAGGGLALGQAMRYRDSGWRMPDRIVLFSPWVDLTLRNPAVELVAPLDPVLSVPALRRAGEFWAGESNPDHPAVSPLYGDLRALPPIDVYQGTHDVLHPDAWMLTEKAKACGGQASFSEYPGAFHVFVGATFTPEARTVYSQVSRSLQEEASDSTRTFAMAAE